jgi:hypothetical protein
MSLARRSLAAHPAAEPIQRTFLGNPIHIGSRFMCLVAQRAKGNTLIKTATQRCFQMCSVMVMSILSFRPAHSARHDASSVEAQLGITRGVFGQLAAGQMTKYADQISAAEHALNQRKLDKYAVI